MVKPKPRLVVSSLLALTVTGSTALVTMGAAVHGGGGLGSAVPEQLAPASSSIYVGLDRTVGGQGTALGALVNTYLAHPGTSAIPAGLHAALGPMGNQAINTLFSVGGNRIGLSVWTPPAANPSVPARFALIAQLKAASISTAATGGNPLRGLVSFSSPMPYNGATIYRITFSGGAGSPQGYGAIVSGDGVLASDLTAIERVVDTATFRAPSLLNDPNFTAATGSLPAPRALTVYASQALVKQGVQALLGATATSGAAAALPAQTRQYLTRIGGRGYALGFVAQPRGLSIVTSSVPALNANALSPDPNALANVVGNNALYYASQNNLARQFLGAGTLTPAMLAQLKAQTGIDIMRDVVPLFSGETAINLNDEVSPLVQRLLGSAAGGATIGTVPGSIEIVTQVADVNAANAALQRIATAVLRSASGGAGAGVPVVKTPRGDGGFIYSFAALPGLEYTFRGNTLILSTSLAADLQAAGTPLAADAGFQTGLVNAAGPGTLVSVQYLNVTRLLRFVDRIVQVTRTGGATVMGATSLRQAEAYIAPFSGVTSEVRAIGPLDEQLRTFIAVQ